MKKQKHIYIFIGTTAELIKIAPVIKELKRRKIGFKLITTGQNQIIFSDMAFYLGDVKPDIVFEGKNTLSSVVSFSTWTVKTFISCIIQLRSEFKKKDKKHTYLLVHGDTVSSLLGSLVAKFFGLKLAHIESGLRSFNFFEPFPEEICRNVVSYLSDINFCPNSWAVDNIKDRKGVAVNTKQNTLYESYQAAMGGGIQPEVLKTLKKKYFILVVHRQEHVIFGKNSTKRMLELILKHSDKNLQCVLIMHALTQNFFDSEDPALFAAIKKRSVIIPRLPFPQYMRLLAGSEFIITDGGSNQEETNYMGKPCLLLRNVTERIEGLGENVVLSKGDEILIVDFLKNYNKYNRSKISMKVFPSKIIVDYLVKS